jgi:small-conductance mechanosensitive channel
MNKEIYDFLNYLTPAKFIGILFAFGTLGYLFYLTIKHKTDFWEAFKGENKKLEIIEAVIIVWLVLFVAMVVGDFTLQLHASDHVWYSMDAIFFACVLGHKFAPKGKDKTTITEITKTENKSETIS